MNDALWILEDKGHVTGEFTGVINFRDGEITAVAFEFDDWVFDRTVENGCCSVS